MKICKRILSVVLCVVVLIGTVPIIMRTEAASGNLIKNPGFENSTTGFSTSGTTTFEVIADPDNAANHVLHVVGGGGYWQTVAVEPNKNYVWTFRMKDLGNTGTTRMCVFPTSNWYSIITSVTENSSEAYSALADGVATVATYNQTWQTFTVKFNSGENTAVKLWHNMWAANREVYMDDWMLYKDSIFFDPTPFDLREDGYCFVNSYQAFGYKEGDKIPYSTYCAVYPFSYTPLKYLFESKWGGNCFGMSTTSILFNEGLRNKDNYGGKNKTVNEIRTGIKANSNWNYYHIDDTHYAKFLIEYYQIWQSSWAGQKAKKDIIFGVEKNGSKVINSANYLLNNLDNYLLEVFLDNWGGHALVVNTDIEPDYLGDGWYRIYLYDPNNPCVEGHIYREYDAKYTSNFIDININNNHYKINAGTRSDGTTVNIGYDENDNYINSSRMFFRNYEGFDFDSIFLLSADNTITETQTEQIVKLSAKDISVYDSEDNLLFDVENNLITYIDDSIEFEYPAGYTVDSGYDFAGNLILPIGEYKYDFGADGTVQVDDGENFTAFKGEEGTDTTVKEDGTVVLGGEKGSETDVLVQNNYDNDFTAINTTVSNNGTDDTVITLNSDDTLDVETTEETFDIKVETSGQKNTYLLSDTTALETAETPVTELIEEKGEKIPNSMKLVDVEYESHIEYDGETHNNKPVVTFLGEELEEGVDYVLSGDTVASESGKYSFKITGKGDYEGEIEKSFNLLPKLNTPESKLTFNEKFGFEYSVDKSVLTDGVYTNPKLSVFYNGETIELSNYIETEDKLIFALPEINAEDFKNTIPATLTAEFDEYIYKSETIEYSPYSLGKLTCDANGDEAVDLRDLVRLKKHLSENADINGADPDSSGKIDSLDMAFLRKFMLFS